MAQVVVEHIQGDQYALSIVSIDTGSASIYLSSVELQRVRFDIANLLIETLRKETEVTGNNNNVKD